MRTYKIIAQRICAINALQTALSLEFGVPIVLSEDIKMKGSGRGNEVAFHLEMPFRVVDLNFNYEYVSTATAIVTVQRGSFRWMAAPYLHDVKVRHRHTEREFSFKRCDLSELSPDHFDIYHGRVRTYSGSDHSTRKVA